MDTIYIEQEVLDHPQTKKILKQFAKAEHLVIDRYSEVFNSHAQNFRLQKINPALILANKNNKKVHAAPDEYETGGGAGYYFSHMLNCLYDCRYCFLQGMFRSANYLLFVNYQDFFDEIAEVADQHKADEKPVWFYSGYDCDSLAMEPVTQFADYLVPKFVRLENSVLELRTKSTQIRALLEHTAQPNVVVAYSLSPQDVASAVEAGAPTLAKRIEALQKLQDQGWRIGLRFDPIIWHANYQSSYAEMLQQVFAKLDANKIDSVTLGGFRLPKGFYKSMRRLYPEHWLFSAGLTEKEGMVTYTPEIDNEVLSNLEQMITQYIDSDKLYKYTCQ